MFYSLIWILSVIQQQPLPHSNLAIYFGRMHVYKLQGHSYQLDVFAACCYVATLFLQRQSYITCEHHIPCRRSLHATG